MNEKDVIKVLARHGDHQRRYDVMIPNCYTSHDNEADLFAIRKSGLCDEFEVKVSRSDFLVDAKKRVMHRQCKYGEWDWEQKGLEFAPYTKSKREALSDGDMDVNYFWYVVKDGICEASEVPEFAGLIVVPTEESRVSRLKIIRSPKRLHTRKLSMEERFRYARKTGYRFWNLFLSKTATSPFRPT